MRALSLLFDKPASNLFWTRQGGLFGYSDLRTPEDFAIATTKTIARASRLLDTVVRKPLRDGWTRESHQKLTVKRLDRLSDMLCAVVDVAELIRNIHPRKDFIDAANDAHEKLSHFLNTLNTHHELYITLKEASLACSSQWDTDEKIVCQLLLTDFEKSGIHLAKARRDIYVELNNRILSVGQEFMLGGSSSTDSHITLAHPASSLIGVDTKSVAKVTSVNGLQAHVPVNSQIAYQIMRQCRNADTRRLVYLGMNAGSHRQVDLLQDFLSNRQRVAELVGYQSYGHLWLKDKMVKSPENVLSFLKNLKASALPMARAELNSLVTLKRTYTGQDSTFNAWDRYFYAQILPPPVNVSSTSSNLTVGQTMEALSWVFTKLFGSKTNLFYLLIGISLQASPLKNGETWHADVKKLDVMCERNGLIGIVYCDLFERAEPKFQGAAHFTVKCSRCIDFDADDTFDSEDTEIFKNPIHIYVNGNVKYQLPVVVLSTLFFKGTEKNPTILSQHEIETVFHEMGHAMHSMLAKTRFQHISGTRVVMDFVEVPSTLMEKFSHPRIVQQFKNERYGELVDVGAMMTHSQINTGLDSVHQIDMAMIDQLYHANNNGVIDTTEIAKRVVNESGLIPHADGTRLQSGFTHLFTYGASYYSYAWSRLIADRIWDDLFKGKGPNEWRRGGDTLQSKLLNLGGGKDPWECLESMDLLKPGERETKAFHL